MRPPAKPAVGARFGGYLLVAALAVSLPANVVLLWRPAPAARTAGDGDRALSAEERKAARRRKIERNVAACQRGLGDLRVRWETWERARRDMAALDFDQDGFSKRKQNLALESSVRRQFAQLVSAGRALYADVRVECREALCLLSSTSAEAPQIFDKLQDDEWIRTNVRQGDWGSGVAFVKLREQPLADGRAILRGVLEAFKRSGAIESCASRNALDGSLNARVDLSSEDDNLDDRPPGFSVHVGGTLVGSRLGDCVTLALESAMRATPLPPRHSSATELAALITPPPPLPPPPLPSGPKDVPRRPGLSFD
jgi:hypothetical protein